MKRFSNIVDYDAGLAILQRKSKGNLIDSTYLTFKCGYQSKTHKHLDDLSLTYYLNGHDLFIDPGKYSYDIKDPIREYLISPEAHTTISIKGKNYKLSNPFIDTNSLRITKYYSTTNYRIITGINKLYENVVINRTLIITNEPVVIVIDRVVANNTEIINQNFNINPQAKIIKSSDEQYEIKINKSSYILETLKINNRKITSKIKDGFVSYKFADYSKNKRVVFEQINKSSTFVTHIAEKNIKIKNISFENKVLSFTCNDKSYNIDL